MSLDNWLKDNRLINLSAKLKENGITKVDDLQEFENEDDVNELVNDICVKIIARKKLKRAILKLIAYNDEDNKNEDCLQELNQYGIPQIVRNRLKPRIKKNRKTTVRNRLKPVWDTPNAHDDIIKCIGSLRIEFDNHVISTDRIRCTCIGTATIINVSDDGYGFLLTSASNAYQFLRKCTSCKTTTISPKCTKCSKKCVKIRPKQLIKATYVTFSQRCIEKQVTHPHSGNVIQFGDTMEIYDVEEFVIPKLYEQHSSVRDGYNVCMMKFKFKDDTDAAKYKNICERIKLVDEPFVQAAKLHIYGYPFDKDNQMYGMSNEMDSDVFILAKNDKTGKSFIKNRAIDTQAGQDGACIWSYSNKTNTSIFHVYGIHVGGKQGVNFGTFLDLDTIKWINQTQFRLTLKPGFNTIPSERREYMISDLKENEVEYKLDTKHTKNANKIFSIKTTFTTNQNVVVKIEQREPEKLVSSDGHKIILMCGETGSGKTCLINSIMNYVYDIKQEDNFRLKLIEEEKTEYITSYTIKKPEAGNIDYDLTIIDTPGFGDTHGIQKDIQTVKQFQYVFEKILIDINGIFFVVKSSVNRFTKSQQYVFNNILNLWGKNVAQNIFVLMTFADAQPQCMDALNLIEALKNSKHKFPMNNSAFLTDPAMQNNPSNPMYQIQKYFWQMGMQCFEKIFRKLEEIAPIPTEASKHAYVLEKREKLLNQIRIIKEGLADALLRQKEIKRIENHIRKNCKEIDEGKERIEMIQKNTRITEPVPKSDGQLLICHECEINCHVCNWSCRDIGKGVVLAAGGTAAVATPTAVAAGGAIIGSVAGPIGAGIGAGVGYYIGAIASDKFAKKMDKFSQSRGISCSLMSKKQCTVCGCAESKHSQGLNKYVTIQVTVSESNWDKDYNVKKKYQQDKSAVSRSQWWLNKLQKELDENERRVEHKIAMMQKLQNELDTIALRPKLTCIGAYIDELIKNEEENENRYEVKKMLKKMKEEEKHLEKLQQSGKLSKEDFGYSSKKNLG